ncbi:MAG: hypothetical protein JO149_09455, partial [Gammaproteobacteria bacterium]|nr:hypothetical protein [Gammaproteobacteria bacterium]
EGADLNIKNIYEETLIEIASEMNRQDIVLLLEKKKTQQKSVAKIYENLPNLKESTILISIRLHDLFYAYAHPPLFSFTNRSHGPLASAIAQNFKQHPEWDTNQCKKYLDEVINKNKAIISPEGTFSGTLNYAYELIKLTMNTHQPKSGMQKKT